MDIRDTVHGVIRIENHELPIIDSYIFQRLRQIKQTGFAEHSYPGATHNRYVHSLGAMQTITHTFEAIFPKLKQKNKEAWRRFRALARFAALLHDVGHGPLSHTTEFAMGEVGLLKIPGQKKIVSRKATHEDYTLKILLDSPLTPLLEQACAPFGFSAFHIAATLDASLEVHDDFFTEVLEGEKLNFRPLLHQLISSELDADRMDYLQRDSFYCGVSYGVFDYSWIVSNLCAHIKDGRYYLGLNHRALYAFEDFLLSRYHMFLMVYLHHKTVVFDEMLSQYLHDPECTYSLPSDIESYVQCTDAELYANLSASKNEWARRIVEKRPLRMLLETHSGIPITDNAREQQEKLFQSLCEELKEKKIKHIATKSTGELSKYFGKFDHPIFVKYDNLYSKPSFISLQKCTPLFTQYPTIRSISRVYVTPEEYTKIKKQGRSEEMHFD